MKNFLNKIKYLLVNTFGMEVGQTERDNYERIYEEDFRTFNNWQVIHPNTASASRSDGATLCIRQVNSKNFVTPQIISKTKINGGAVIVSVRFSYSENVSQKIVLQNDKEQIGFQIEGKRIYILAPNKTTSIKLFKPTEMHTLEIDINREKKITYFMVDSMVVYEINQVPEGDKNLSISMNAANQTLHSFQLPVYLKIKNVDFLTNNLLIDK